MSFFEMGGVFMFPTLVLGLVLFVAAVLYAVRPSRRLAAVVVRTGLATVLLGILGSTTSFIRTLQNGGPHAEWAVVLVGLSESLSALVLALYFAVSAAVCAALGALRDRGLAAPTPGATGQG